MSLDPANPPKYCPDCEWNGNKSKVKKMKVDKNSRIIMCKNEECPWPFSVNTIDEVTVYRPNKNMESSHPILLKKRDVFLNSTVLNLKEHVVDELYSDKGEETLTAPLS